MLSVGAKWADIAGRRVDEAMPNHLIFALKSFSTFTARTSFDGAIVWSVLRVNIRMRTRKNYLAKEPHRTIAVDRTYFRRYCVWNGGAMHPGASHLNPPVDGVCDVMPSILMRSSRVGGTVGLLYSVLGVSVVEYSVDAGGGYDGP
jgi:hypothetical protein